MESAPTNDSALAEYLNRQFQRLETLEMMQQPIVTNQLPDKPTVGKLYYFTRTIGATITSIGLWLYKATGWVNIA